MSLDVYLYVDIDVGREDKERIYLYDANITHNMNTMADHAGIYEYLWKPEEVNAKYAKDIIKPVEKGLILMKSDPKRFEKFNPSNGWGSYDGFIKWIEKYLEACKKYPNAMIEVNR